MKYLRILKKYRNGRSLFFAKFKYRIFTKSFLKEVAEYVGENTDGGHNYWMDVYVTKAKGFPEIKEKPSKLSGFKNKMNPTFTELNLVYVFGDYK